VIATASTADKRAVVSGLGAHHVLDPADPDLARTIKALTGERGVDAVFDPVGGDLALAATRAIGWGGRYLIVGFASGTVPSFPANHALIKGYSLIGLRAGEARRRDPALDARTRKALSEFAARGALKPHISHRFALEEAGAALKALEDRAVIGRAVIII
jgi:NADPH2:quinone reductase